MIVLEHVLGPVMVGFGDGGDDVLDLVLEAEAGSRRQKQQLTHATRSDVFRDDRQKQPAGALFVGADQPDPTRRELALDRPSRDEPESPFELVAHSFVRIGVRADLVGRRGFERRRSVWWTAGNGEIAERSPDLIPFHRTVRGENKIGRAGHWRVADLSTQAVARWKWELAMRLRDHLFSKHPALLSPPLDRENSAGDRKNKQDEHEEIVHVRSREGDCSTPSAAKVDEWNPGGECSSSGTD